jgi:hypothetical protein
VVWHELVMGLPSNAWIENSNGIWEMGGYCSVQDEAPIFYREALSFQGLEVNRQGGVDISSGFRDNVQPNPAAARCARHARRRDSVKDWGGGDEAWGSSRGGRG